MHTRSYISSGRNVEMPHAPRFRRGCVRPGSDNNSAGAAENGRRRALVKKERMHNRNKEKERNKNKREEIDIYARFSDRAVCTRTREEDSGDVTGKPFPSIAWLHPHAATVVVEAHNLATVARYNRYCGRGLNGGELAQVKLPHRHDNPSVGRATPRLCSLSIISHPTQPFVSFSIAIHLPSSFLFFPHPIELHLLPFPLSP